MPERKRLAVYNLARIRIPAIGVLVPQLGNPFVAEAIRGIQQVTGERGYEVIFASSRGSVEKVDGLLAIGDGVPVVSFGGSSVMADAFLCGYLATEHLIGQGCRRIVLELSSFVRDTDLQQYMGFRQALTGGGPAHSGEVLIAEGGEDIAGRVLGMETLPDGLIITNEQAAIGCLHGLKDAGVRLPEDVAIVGFDDGPASRLIAPALTTIDPCGFEIGRTAAVTLLDQLGRRRALGEPTTVVVPPALIIRKSSLRSQAGFVRRP